jgi:uncharacterized protein (TIGR02646 family)
MRPVKKLSVGDTIKIDGKDVVIKENYNDYGKSLPILEANLGQYCSYCEVFSSDTEVEHIISKDQDKSLETKWDNFLIACGRCNGGGNKSNKPVDLDNIYFPHTHNTFMCFSYLEGGIVQLNPTLTENQKVKAENLMNLVGLDKYPSNKKYPKHTLNDKQWSFRRTAWELADRFLADYLSNTNTTAEIIATFAIQRGFFSIWFTVFQAHDDVKKALIEKFAGTAAECFDASNQYAPIKRAKEI